MFIFITKMKPLASWVACHYFLVKTLKVWYFNIRKLLVLQQTIRRWTSQEDWHKYTQLELLHWWA